jgi:hypothetical protein
MKAGKIRNLISGMIFLEEQPFKIPQNILISWSALLLIIMYQKRTIAVAETNRPVVDNSL